MLPLCLFRHWSHLAYVATISLGSIVLVLFLVVIGAPIRAYSGSNGDSSSPVHDHIRLFDWQGSFRSIGSIIFAVSVRTSFFTAFSPFSLSFSQPLSVLMIIVSSISLILITANHYWVPTELNQCNTATFQAYESIEQKYQTPKGWARVTSAAVLIGGSMCFVMGLIGYLSFRNSTNGQIVDNFTSPHHGYDFFKVAILVHFIFCAPAHFILSRYSLVKLCCGREVVLINQTITQLILFSVSTQI